MIGCRWCRLTPGVRVVVTQDPQAGPPGSALDTHQVQRVALESAARPVSMVFDNGFPRGLWLRAQGAGSGCEFASPTVEAAGHLRGVRFSLQRVAHRARADYFTVTPDKCAATLVRQRVARVDFDSFDGYQPDGDYVRGGKGGEFSH